MLLKELLAMQGVEIKDTTLRFRLKELYKKVELLAYVIFKTSGLVHSFAFVFKGERVWYGVVDGRRATVKQAMNFIQTAKVKGDVNMTRELRGQLLLEEL